MLGGLLGFKRGIVKSAVSFFGVLIIVGLAFALKNPLSEFLYTHLPFINLGEAYAGLSIVNIVIYEAIAFLFLVLVFAFLLKLVISLTGVVEKILKMTIVLGFASKVLGMIFGLIEAYIIVFAVLFIGNNFSGLNKYIEEGNLATKMLNSTPGLTSAISNETKALGEIYALQLECGDAKGEDKIKCNEKSMEIMLKYNVLDKDVAKKLVEDGKISVPNIDEIIDGEKEYNNEMKEDENND